MGERQDETSFAGFWSYARDDDKDYKGYLSALRDAIQSKVRSLLGFKPKNFVIFQDITIRKGEKWEDAIKRASDRAHFFIPIITPTSVRSEQCLREFEHFLRREEALGRSDRIFPILFLPTPELENPETLAQKLVADVIRSRQYDDWTALINLGLDDSTVKHKISTFAQSVYDALKQKPDKPPQPLSGEQNIPQWSGSRPANTSVRRTISQLSAAVLTLTAITLLYLWYRDAMLWTKLQWMNPGSYITDCSWPCFYRSEAQLVDDERRKKDGFEADLHQAKAQFEKVNQQLESSNVEQNSLKEKLLLAADRIQSIRTQMSKNAANFDRLSKHKTDLQLQLSDVQTAMAVLRANTSRKLETRSAQLAEMESRLQVAINELTSRRDAVEAANKTIAALNSELEKLKNGARTAAELVRLKDAEKARRKAEMQVTDLERNVTQLNEDKAKLSAELGEQANQLQKMGDLAKRAEGELAAKRDVIAKLESSLALATSERPSAGPSAAASTLDDVKTKGFIQCGVSQGLIGFSNPDEQNKWTGLDVDFCRAVAAAVFGDPEKVKYTPLTAKERFTALQSGEIDILSRNTIWTMSRDTSLGLKFAGVMYYDGQGFMVKKSIGVKSALELNGAAVCVQAGTTTELNLADYFKANKMEYKVVAFETNEEVLKAYDSGRCDVLTTDQSGLYAERLKLSQPDEHIVLPEIISTEPIGPVIRQGDDVWFNVVRWVYFAILTAEALGIDSKNIDGVKTENSIPEGNREIQRLLGIRTDVDNDFGKGIGLGPDWAYNVIKSVGNYAEIFERNIGDSTPLKIARGTNKLWKEGGLQYAPPIR